MKSDFQMVDYSVLGFRYDVRDPAAQATAFHFQLNNRIGIAQAENKGSITSLVTVTGDKDLDEESAVKIQMLFSAAFRTADGADSGDFKRMLSLNGMATIIPIIRSTLLTASSVLGIKGKVILPNIDITKLEWSNDAAPQITAEDISPPAGPDKAAAKTQS